MDRNLSYSTQDAVTSLQQNGFQEPLLYYLKNNASPKLLLKLMQTSKYFCYKEFPCIVIRSIAYDVGKKEWIYSKLNSDKYETLDIENISKKLWITHFLYLSNPNPYHAYFLIPKIAVCDVERLHFFNQRITLDEFKILTATSTQIAISSTIVRDKNGGKIIPLEILLKHLQKIQVFHGSFYGYDESLFTTESTKNLIEALSNSECVDFSLTGIPDTFDFDAFSEYMHENAEKKFLLGFHYNISNEYAQKLLT